MPVGGRAICATGTWWVPTLVIEGKFLDNPRSTSILAQLKEYTHKFWSDSALNPYSTTSYKVAPPVPDSIGFLYIVERAALPLLAGTDVISPYELPGL